MSRCDASSNAGEPTKLSGGFLNRTPMTTFIKSGEGHAALRMWAVPVTEKSETNDMQNRIYGGRAGLPLSFGFPLLVGPTYWRNVGYRLEWSVTPIQTFHCD